MTNTQRARWGGAVRYFILVLGCLLVLLPVSWMIITSLKTMQDITLSKGVELFPNGPTGSNYITIWSEYPMLSYIKNSLISVGGSTVFAVVCAALCGYGLSRYEFGGKKFLLSFLLVTQMFPAVMKIIPYYKILVNVPVIANGQIGLGKPCLADGSEDQEGQPIDCIPAVRSLTADRDILVHGASGA